VRRAGRSRGRGRSSCSLATSTEVGRQVSRGAKRATHNIIKITFTLLQPPISPPPWTQFWMRLQKLNCGNPAHLSRTANLPKYQCDRTTLSRKHQGLTDSHAGANRARANLTPEQDLELAKYIEQLSGEGLP
jgi:hypothetical protein